MKRGFTLVEVVVVIAILGITAAAVVPASVTPDVAPLTTAAEAASAAAAAMKRRTRYMT